MELKIELFAALSHAAGTKKVTVILSDNATVGALLDELGRQIPALAGMLSSVSVAVNMEYANTSLVLSDHDEIALIPPVSGG